MKHYIEFIAYQGKDVMPIRIAYVMPDISAEEYDTNIHQGALFKWTKENGLITEISKMEDIPADANMMYCWSVCRPENDEERDKLISMGKWMSKEIFDKQYPSTKQTTNL